VVMKKEVYLLNYEFAVDFKAIENGSYCAYEMRYPGGD